MAQGYASFKYENTPVNETATPAYGTKQLFARAVTTKPSLNLDHLDRQDELGTNEPLAMVPEQYAPSWALESRFYPDHFGYFAKAMLGAPTTTAGNGVITDPDANTIPTGAYRHVWSAPFFLGPTPQTFEGTWSYKDESDYYRVNGCMTEAMSLSTPETGGARMQVSGPALYMQKVSDPALTPTYESPAVAPFTRRKITLNWLSGSATTDDFSVNIASPVQATHTFGSGSMFPDLAEVADTGLITFSGTISKRALGGTDFAAAVAATGFSAKVKWESVTNIGATSYPYRVWIEFVNAQLTSADLDDLTNARRQGGTYNWMATTAGTGVSAKITLVGSTASYA